jgi:hypothetical protein
MKCPRCPYGRVEARDFDLAQCMTCGWEGPASEAVELATENPDDKMFTDIRPPGIFYRTQLTLHTAYSGPRDNAVSHVAVRMPQDGKFNILALGPAIQMAMATFAKQHPDGFEKAIEELVEGAMHVAGHSKTRKAEDDRGEENT